MRLLTFCAVLLLVLAGGCGGGTEPPPGAPDPNRSSPVADAASEQQSRARIEAMIGTSDFRITRTFRAGFESGADNFGSYVEPSGHMGTTYHELSSMQVHSGKLAHHAWINGTNTVIPGQNTSHRGYPTFQFQRSEQGPFAERVLTELWVWLDIKLSRQPDRDWFSFMTVTSYADESWGGRVLTLNLDADGHVYLMHVPGQTQSTHDIFQTRSIQFPQRRWVKLSLLIDYTAKNPFGSPYAAAWQDGQLVSAARFNPRIDPSVVDRALWPACLAGWGGASISNAEARCGLVYKGGLVQAHFGMYAAAQLSSGTVFNDDLAVYELKH